MKIQEFREFSENDMELIGGKGLSLVKMIKGGFNIPNGFIIPVGMELNPENSQEILNIFDRLKMSKVAVRSSATVEDGANNSWAGQFSSYLNITRETLIEHINLVQQSVNNVRADVYSGKANVKELRMAVVVQSMVDASSSGIAFSINPVTKDNTYLVIEAGLGLGEPIVSGMVTPDNYIVKKDTFEITKKINIQNQALYNNEYKTLTQEVSESQKITDDQIKEIADQIIKLENFYNIPIDVEWAYSDKLYILQTRPITMTEKSTIQTLIDKINNNGEYESEGTEIFFSWLVEDCLINATSKEMQEKIFGFHIPFDKYLVINGDEYLAKNSILFNEDIYQEKYETEGIKFFTKQFIAMLNLCDNTEKYRKELLTINFANKSNIELSEIFKTFINTYLDIFTSGINEPSSTLEEELCNSLSKIIPSQELDTALTIVKTKSNIRSLDYVDEPLNLLYLSKEIQDQYGRELPTELSEELNKKVNNHALEYGYLQNLPEFYEDTRPTVDYYLDRIKYFIKSNIDEKINKILNAREKVEADYKDLVEKYQITGDTLELCEAVRVCIMMRTYKVSYTDKLYYTGRYSGLFDEVANRLKITVEDLQAMSGEEIYASLNGKNIQEDLVSRREGYYILWNSTGAEFGFGKELASVQQMMRNKYIAVEEKTDSNSVMIKGNPANMGIVKGKVRIVTLPNEMEKFEDGEILVTTMTRPELIPAMEKAIGFITNEGGMTCHAAIVSREFNIPCIVGTMNATEILHDGDYVELDAINGIIRIIK